MSKMGYYFISRSPSPTSSNIGCQMNHARSVMNVEKSLIHFGEGIIVDYVVRYSVTGVVILKSLVKLWDMQVSSL